MRTVHVGDGVIVMRVVPSSPFGGDEERVAALQGDVGTGQIAVLGPVERHAGPAGASTPSFSTGSTRGRTRAQLSQRRCAEVGKPRSACARGGR